ncbi:MAG: tRNA (adenine(22)-N(1))-methyltransferase TrmK [Eubacterium ramulus]
MRTHGFRILEEEMILEDGKYYPMMKVVQETASDQREETVQVQVEDAFGPVLLQKKHPVLKEWLQRELKTVDTVCRQLAAQPENERITIRMAQVQEKRQLILEALKRYETADVQITIQGTEREYPRETTFQQIADEYQSQMENDIVLVKFQQDLRELHPVSTAGRRAEFITTAEKPGKRYLPEKCDASDGGSGMEAVSEPGASCPAFHWSGATTVNSAMRMPSVCRIRKMLATLRREDAGILWKRIFLSLKYNMSTQDASARFRQMGRMDKVRLMRYRRSSRVNVYELQEFPDYYYGYMVPGTGYLKYFDLIPYQNGFMLMFPGKDPKESGGL